jgi:DNA repair protein RadD
VKPLRDYQARGIDMLRASLRSGKRRPVLQLPTGAGKTRVAAEIISLAREKGHRAIFTVPRISLIEQTVDAFMHEAVVEIGVMQQAHELTDPSQPVQVASLDTLARRDIPPADLVIVDEAHLQREFLLGWMARPEWQRVPFVGLSATPWTKGMGRHWDDLVVISTTAQMIEEGHLSPFRVFAPSHPDLSGVKTVAGDYHEGQLADAMSDPTLVADVVDTWLERAGGRPTLCFAVNRAHAKHLRDKFEAAGISAGYVDCYSSLEDRADLAKRFKAGDVQVACSVGVLTTGIDWSVGCISLARPTKSEMLFVQMIGRGLRRDAAFERYGDCLILDHSDTTLRLGFVTDIHHEHLDDGRERQKQEKREALPKECPQCAFLKPPKARTCPACGLTTQHVAQEIECEDGELVELASRRPNEKTDWSDKESFYGQLKAFARERRYRDGWAANQYRNKFGVWPNDPRVKYARERSPTPEVRAWITSRQIAFAKGRAA